MEQIVIAAYSSTCMGLPPFLAEFMAATSRKFAFELAATGSTRTMLSMLTKPEDITGGADLALFTLPDAALSTVDDSLVRIEATAQFAYVVIAPEALLENANFVTSEWLSGKDVVTYGGGSSGAVNLRELLGTFEASQGQVINGVADTLTVNEVVKAGLAVGVAVGLNSPYEVAPGIRAVPITPSTPATTWRSYVGVRKASYETKETVKLLYHRLVELDKSEAPGWLIANPALGLHPYHQRLVRDLSQRLNTTEVEVVRQALDLYNLALEEMHRNRLLTITDTENSVSYPIELKLIANEEDRSVS